MKLNANVIISSTHGLWYTPFAYISTQLVPMTPYTMFLESAET